ncbi:MAG: hypothetical protein CSA36_07310 [Draconibacterium sp.]|nr:MAG: hypothetical protein CSA36_07310 [Draconibacterium sp.]
MNIGKSTKKEIQFLITVITGFLLILSYLPVFAQQSDSIVPIKKDPEVLLRKINIKSVTKHGFNFWQDDFTGHWAGIDFGFNTFVNTDYTGYDTEFMKSNLFRSNSLYINLIQQSIGLQANRNTIGLVTGLGVQFKGYRLDRNTTFERQPNGRIVPVVLTYNDNQRSKLSLIYLTLPLLAEFQVPVKHYNDRFYFSGGLFMGYRVSAQTKVIYRVDKKEKLKIPDSFSTPKLKYGVMVRAGYRWINLFATYDFQPFFKEGLGPQLTPLTFGFTILGF